MGIKIKNETNTEIYYSNETGQLNGSGSLEPGQETKEIADLNAEIGYFESVGQEPVPGGFFGSFTPGEDNNFSVFTVIGGVTKTKL